MSVQSFLISSTWSTLNSIAPSRVLDLIMQRNSPSLNSLTRKGFCILLCRKTWAELSCRTKATSSECCLGIIFQCRVPIHFWGECVLTATFLINRTPSVLLKNSSPFKLLYKTKVDYSSFKVFGCLAFASTLHAHREKFDPRAELCAFLGYPTGMTGYKLYDV